MFNIICIMSLTSSTLQTRTTYKSTICIEKSNSDEVFYTFNSSSLDNLQSKTLKLKTSMIYYCLFSIGTKRVCYHPISEIDKYIILSLSI